jgi:hypothetical protein
MLRSRLFRYSLAVVAVGCLAVSIVVGELARAYAAPAAEGKADKPAAKAPVDAKPTDAKPTEKNKADKKDDKKKADDKKQAEKFLRVVRDAAGEPIAMETSIVTYRPKKADGSGLQVDLIGAVHVADHQYYETLNKVFDDYDVVLYELVAPEGTKIPKGGRGGSTHPIGMIQQGMKNILNLEFQLEQIDYTKKHFVHADMSPDEFSKTMEERGESFLQMFFKMMGAAVAQQSGKQGGAGASDADMIMALLSPDRAYRLKRVMALQFENLGGTMNVLEGPKGSTIIGERNRKALEVLKKQIDGGKKKIAIFYGAGHMTDMEKKLAADFNLEPGEVKWIEAWDLRKSATGRKKPKKTESPKAAKEDGARKKAEKAAAK